MITLPWRQPTTRQTGSVAEDSACAFLQEQGLALLARNFTVRSGELDLVMQDGETLVFVEVRFRQAQGRGSALETVTARKQARIRSAAAVFLQRHPALAERPCRFDVIGMEPDGQRTSIEWVRDAFA